DASLEMPYTTPNMWYRDAADAIGLSGMFLSGLIMVMHNRYLAWPAVLLGINNTINAHSMHLKEGGTGWSNL
ncbi:hypothetical protein CPB84DRAFT_1638046, partial [Gymnopilus junonius]